MANINNFYPQRLKGRALGLNAGGGNIGVAAVQVVGALLLAVGGAATDPRVLLYVYVPLVLLCTAFAWTQMDNLTEATNDRGAMREVARHPHTWVVSFLYVGTFGSFIGFSFAFGQVLAAAGADRPIYYVWIGALVGSLIRPVGGMLADRHRGSVVTFWTFLGMTAAATLVLVASRADSIPVFVLVFSLLFVLTGIGNGSVYKMIPAVFHAEAATRLGAGADPAREASQARRLASALVGIAGAVGALGGVLVQLAFRQSFLTLGDGTAAYVAFLGFYALCAAVTWAVYLRPSQDRLVGV